MRQSLVYRSLMRMPMLLLVLLQWGAVVRGEDVFLNRDNWMKYRGSVSHPAIVKKEEVSA